MTHMESAIPPEIRSPAYTVNQEVLAAALPPWDVAIKLCDDGLSQSEREVLRALECPEDTATDLNDDYDTLAAYTACKSRIDIAQTKYPLFASTLRHLYVCMRLLQEPDSKPFTYPTSDFLVQAAASLTARLPHPAEAVAILYDLERPEALERSRRLHIAWLSAVNGGRVHFNSETERKVRIAHAHARLNPHARRATYQAILTTLYGERYTAYKNALVQGCESDD